MKKLFGAMALICAMVFSLATCTGALAETDIVSEAPDYSQEDSWLQLPEITKNVDTFYIYSTVYADDAPDAPALSPMDDAAMRDAALANVTLNSDIFSESTNVFAPYYRQSNLAAIAGLQGDELLDFQRREQAADIREQCFVAILLRDVTVTGRVSDAAAVA